MTSKQRFETCDCLWTERHTDNFWKFGVVVNTQELFRAFKLEHICSNFWPWTWRHLLWYQRYLTVGIPVLVTNCTLSYKVFNVLVHFGPKQQLSCSCLCFYYALGASYNSFLFSSWLAPWVFGLCIKVHRWQWFHHGSSNTVRCLMEHLICRLANQSKRNFQRL